MSEAEDHVMPEMKAIKWMQKNILWIVLIITFIVVFIITTWFLNYQEPAFEFIMRDKAGTMLQCNKTETGALCSVFYCAETEGMFQEEYCFDLQTTQTLERMQ